MRVSYKWLKRLLPEMDVSVEEAARTLTFLGLEVERVESVGDDHVFELEITSNRPDCLSVEGVARELSAALRLPLALPEAEPVVSGPETSALTSVEIDAEDLCRRYIAHVIRDVEVAPSPDWLREALEAIGVRSVNNVVDATNYVTMETGQPLHAFDYDRLLERRIVVRRARAGEEIRAIDGRVYPLDGDTLVIADAKFPVAIAGVMGGLDTEVTGATRNVLLEIAWFEPLSIRRTSRRLALVSAAGYRFERGVDPTLAARAGRRCARLIQDTAGGVAAPSPVDVNLLKVGKRRVAMRFSRVPMVMGFSVEPDEAVAALSRLGFETVSRDAESVEVDVPPRRGDVEREIDLIEEVGRLAGLENVPDAVLAARAVRRPRRNELAAALRDFVAAAGLFEAMTDVFVSVEGPLHTFSIEGSASPVVVRNPLRAGTPGLRRSLLPGLLAAVRHNQHRAGVTPELFELGRVFWAAEAPLPREPQLLGLVTGAGYARLRGVVDAALESLGLAARYEPADVEVFEKGFSARLHHDGRAVGVAGLLSRTVCEAAGVRGDLWAAELDGEWLLEKGTIARRFRPIPRHPEVERDIAVVLDADVLWRDVAAAVSDLEIPALRRFVPFDTYTGEQIPKGKKSIAIRLRFGLDERTLQSDEVDEAVDRIVGRLAERFGAVLRK